MRFPKAKVIIGVWGFTGDTERAMQRFQPSRPSKLVTSLAGAVEFVTGADPAAARKTESAVEETGIIPS